MDDDTELVVTVKVFEVDPAGTVRLAGTVLGMTVPLPAEDPERSPLPGRAGACSLGVRLNP